MHLTAPLSELQQNPCGGSGAFLALASDGNRYWVKTLNGPQGNRVAITEQIVGGAGALIGAPVCEVTVVYVPKDLGGWEFRPGHKLQPGCAHGSRALEDVIEEKGCLDHRQLDENSIRHVGYYALYDWCWGDDVQGLLVVSEDRKFCSHDHGLFLPGGTSWDPQNLEQHIDDPHELSFDGAGLDLIEVERVASRLESVTRDEILRVVSRIPRAWPVSDGHLEAVGYFLEQRAPAVASRLRIRFGGK